MNSHPSNRRACGPGWMARPGMGTAITTLIKNMTIRQCSSPGVSHENTWGLRQYKRDLKTRTLQLRNTPVTVTEHWKGVSVTNRSKTWQLLGTVIFYCLKPDEYHPFLLGTSMVEVSKLTPQRMQAQEKPSLCSQLCLKRILTHISKSTACVTCYTRTLKNVHDLNCHIQWLI